MITKHAYLLRSVDKEECSGTNHAPSPSRIAFTISPSGPTSVSMTADEFAAGNTSQTMALTLLCPYRMLFVLVRLLMNHFVGDRHQ